MASKINESIKCFAKSEGATNGRKSWICIQNDENPGDFFLGGKFQARFVLFFYLSKYYRYKTLNHLLRC